MENKLANKKEWIDDARVALFIHWGINTGNSNWNKGKLLYKSIEEFENAVEKNGWSPEKWVETAKKMHAKYITFAIFHCCLGYIRAWKTDIPGAPVTKRDFLNELIEAAEKEDIKVLVYITSDPANSSQYDGISWLDPEVYKVYKHDSSVDILRFDHFQRYFIKDIIGELMNRYPKMAGFWFDGWNDEDICNEVFGYIHEKNPETVIIRNDFGEKPFQDEDLMSIECFGKNFLQDYDYDYASGTWLPPGRCECCYVMIGDWWYYQEVSPANHAVLIKKMVTVLANDWVASMGFGPEIGGDFPESIHHYVEHMYRFFDWAGESFFGTRAGGYSAKSFIPGYWNDGAYGVTTFIPDKDIHYIHVLTPPKTNTLILADSGLKIKKAVFLKNGHELDFVQKDHEIFVKVPSWELCETEGDAIIKMITEPIESIRYTYINKEEASLPCSIKMDLGMQMTMSSLLIEENENSAITSGGWAAPESKRMKNLRIAYSEDGEQFNMIQQCTFKNQRGMKQVVFSPAKARYIHLEVEDAYDTSESILQKWDGLHWEDQSLDEHGNHALAITTDRMGVVWVLKESGEIWRCSGSVWSRIPGAAQNMAMGNDGSIYMIEDGQDDGAICRWDRYHWENTGLSGKRIAAEKDGTIWIVKSDNSLCCSNHKLNTKIEHPVTDVTISPDGTVWICGSERDKNKGYLMYLSEAEWKEVFLKIYPQYIASNSTKMLWIVDEAGRVYGTNNEGTNVFLTGYDAADIRTGADGSLWKIRREVKGTLQVKKIYVIE